MSCSSIMVFKILRCPWSHFNLLQYFPTSLGQWQGLWDGLPCTHIKYVNGMTLIEASNAPFGTLGGVKRMVGPRILIIHKVYDYMVFNIKDIEVVIRL